MIGTNYPIEYCVEYTKYISENNKVFDDTVILVYNNGYRFKNHNRKEESDQIVAVYLGYDYEKNS